MRRRLWMGTGVALLVIGLALGYGLATGSDGPPSSSAESGQWLDRPAPDVIFETLDGAAASVHDYRGTVVLLNFWGTWCAPCRREIPELVEIQKLYSPRGAVVIGVAVESGEPEEIQAFADALGINYPIWVSTAQTALSSYDAIGYPFTLLIDAAGTIRKQYLGAQSVASLAADLEAVIEESRPTAEPAS